MWGSQWEMYQLGMPAPGVTTCSYHARRRLEAADGFVVVVPAHPDARFGTAALADLAFGDGGAGVATTD